MPQLYGLIGYPLGHSFSARFFNDKFNNEHIDAHYSLFPIENIAVLPELIESHPELVGLNVTIPYKEKVIPYLDSISEEAQEIGAVNTIKFQKQQCDSSSSTKLKGYNTDAEGFRKSIENFIPSDIKGSLILGTGGASKAVEYVLKNKGIDILHVSRYKRDNTITYSEITEDILRRYPLIINATPVGMYPNIDDKPDIPYHYLDHNNYCFDLIYNPEETLFLKLASAHGAHTKGGLEMLIYQAIEAWNIWTK